MISSFGKLRLMFFKNRTFKQTVAKNTFWLIFTEIIQRASYFMVLIWIARYLGPDVYGRWAFALSFVGLFSILVDFGFDNFLVRDISRNKEDTSVYLDNIVALKLMLGVAAFILIAITIRLTGKNLEIVKLCYFLGIYVIVNSFATFFMSVFRANEQMQYEALCRVAQSLCLIGLAGVFMLAKGAIFEICYAYIGAAFFGAVLSFLFVWRFFSRIFLKIDLRICVKILKEAWPFGLTLIFVTGYYHADIVMLSFMKNDLSVGCYSAASRVLFFLITIPILLQTSFFPKLSNSFVSSEESFEFVSTRQLEAVLVIVVPIFIGVNLLAERFIILAYGAEFAPAITILRLLMWSCIFASIGGVFGNMFYSSNRQATLVKIAAFAFAMNVLLNLLLIPNLSYMGAGIATNITRFFVIIAEATILLKMGLKIFDKSHLDLCAKIFIAGLAMTAFVFLFIKANLFLIVLGAGAVYFGLLHITRNLILLPIKR